jgi:hypothetical protein
MAKPLIKIHDIESDEVVEREMTNAEFKQYEADQAAQAARLAETEAKEVQRQTILDRLGLTADELKTILG